MKLSIVFSQQLGDFVVDEVCLCGHLKSEHGSLLHRINNKMLREPNDGNCCESGCSCKKFRFAKFVTLDQAADVMLSKRKVVGLNQ